MFLLVFLLSPHSDTLDTVGNSHYQPATDLLAHSEHIYPQSHKSSIVFQLGRYIDGPLCKHLLINLKGELHELSKRFTHVYKIESDSCSLMCLELHQQLLEGDLLLVIRKKLE